MTELRAALTELLWYVDQLEMLVYSADDHGEHESVTRAKAALAAISSATAPQGDYADNLCDVCGKPCRYGERHVGCAAASMAEGGKEHG